MAKNKPTEAVGRHLRRLRDDHAAQPAAHGGVGGRRQRRATTRWRAPRRRWRELSSEFSSWMDSECERLDAARRDVKAKGFTKATRDALFHAAHDIKGQAATFGYPLVASPADSLCRLIEHTPDMNRIPMRAGRPARRRGARHHPREGPPRHRADRGSPDQAAARRHRRFPGAGEQGPAGRSRQHPRAVDRSDRTSF